MVNARSKDEPKEKRGTLDFGLLLVRAIISTYLIIVSVSTFFQIGANPGLTGLQHDFATYTFGSALSIIIPTLQLAAGVSPVRPAQPGGHRIGDYRVRFQHPARH